VSVRVTSPRTFHTVIQSADPQDAMGPQAGRIAAMNEALARLAREISRAL